MRLVSPAIAGLLCACAAAPAAAHEFWLSPSSYAAAAADTVEVRTYVGTGFRGEIKPYAAPRSLAFTLRHARTIDLRAAAMNGSLLWTRFVTPDAGGALVAFESGFAFIELPGADFDRYLELEGLEGPRTARARAKRDATVRERYARCPKTWIAGGEATRVLRPVGLTLELVPLADPTTALALPVRLLFRGKPLRGALVRAWNRPLARDAVPTDAATRDSVPPELQVRTDRDGVATLATDRAGEWLIGAVHMVPSAVRHEADWESYWASLTFARPSPR